jgi:hypothetical protein
MSSLARRQRGRLLGPLQSAAGSGRALDVIEQPWQAPCCARGQADRRHAAPTPCSAIAAASVRAPSTRRAARGWNSAFCFLFRNVRQRTELSRIAVKNQE